MKKKFISQFASVVFLVAILTSCEDSKDENIDKTSSDVTEEAEVKRVDLSSFFSQTDTSVDSENREIEAENDFRPPHHREKNHDFEDRNRDPENQSYDEEYKRQLEEEIQKSYYSNYFSKGVESDSTTMNYYNQPARPVDILPSNQQKAESLNQERSGQDPRYSTDSATGDFPPMPPQMYSR